MTNYTAATERTMYFIGVTTGKSSIMKVFPAWAEHLGLNAVMRGIDFPPNSDPARITAKRLHSSKPTRCRSEGW
jgi:shikimate 5-dehydrogenase